MASSEVGIASSASPFGCVLKDHNWRDRINRNSRENCNKFETAFETKIKYFVQDHHLHASISDSIPLKNPQNAGEWLLNQESNTISDEMRQNEHKKREVSPNLLDDSSIETKTLGCVSSLVQRWREFANTRHTEKTSNPNSPSSSSKPVSSADPNTTLGKLNYFQESVSSVSREATCDSTRGKFDTPCSEKFDTPSMTIGDDAFLDWDSNRSVQTGPPSAQSRNSEDGGERERLRVADVIRKLRLENVSLGNGTEIKMKYQEKMSFSPAISSSPRIRGRQAFNDLLMQLERDRHVELDRLVERQAVSKFSHRGRIQSLLRLRFLRRDAIVRHHHQQQQQSKVTGTQQHSCSTPLPAPQQSSSCEESTTFDNPQISSSSTIGIEFRKPEAKAGKQEESVSKSVAEQNGPCIAEAMDKQHSESLPCEQNQLGQGSKVVLLREKFNALDKTDAATPKTPRGVSKSNILCTKSSSTSNQLREELHQQQEVANSARTSCSSQNSVSKETEEVPSSCSDPLRQEINYEADNNCSRDSEKTSTISNEWELHNLEEHDQNNATSVRLEANYEVENNCSLESEKISDGWELSNKLEEHYQNNSASLQQEANYHFDEFCSPESGKTMTISNEWEDSKNLGEDDQDKDIQSWSEWDEEDISNLSWVSDIARPKSDWENLRQARYQDMLDSDHVNDEMRRLLERRSVSTFLTSNLRDTMDQLMISRVERVPRSMEHHHEHRLEQVILSPIQTQPNIRKEDEEKGERDHNFSDEVRYPSFEQPRSSQSSCPDIQPLSALTTRSSVDMHYMYDLRAYMEQLHQEVSELRKTVNRCMNMKEKMQCSIKQEVEAAVDLSVRKAVEGSAHNTTRTRTCCLCYEMQVNSLLYRCGHMCTCFKCAQELQCSTGKCPICQARILDVVRTYPDGNFIDRK